MGERMEKDQSINGKDQSINGKMDAGQQLFPSRMDNENTSIGILKQKQ
ncbi:MAG: hypothetical protein NVS2B12_35620 [Ktedonobacteraceae bacterium]